MGSWSLVDACPGGDVVASRGGYTEGKTLTHVDVKTDRSSRYLFSILDTGDDGICCEHSSGYYKVYVDGALQLEGGQFGGSETGYFGDCDKEFTNVPTLYPTLYPTLAPTIEDTKPTGSPSPTIKDDEDEVNISITIDFDDYPGDISWELHDICQVADAVMIGEGRGYGPTYANEAVIVLNEVVPHGEFLFVIKDSFGDGLCCTHGDGLYSIVYDGEEIAVSSFEMSGEEIQNFGSSENCPARPDDDTRASYNADLGVPACETVAELCITVSYPSGGKFQAGGMIKVTSHAFIFGNPLVEDLVDFYHTEDVFSDDPVWDYKGTVTPLVPGFTDVESQGFVLGDSPLQAVRVVVRWAAGGMPDPADACPSWGQYNDVDDLVFAVYVP